MFKYTACIVKRPNSEFETEIANGI